MWLRPSQAIHVELVFERKKCVSVVNKITCVRME